MLTQLPKTCSMSQYNTIVKYKQYCKIYQDAESDKEFFTKALKQKTVSKGKSNSNY
jgi:hypothetical protein